MLDVYICEDNPKQLNLFSRYVSDTILIENLDMKLKLAVSDPKGLLDAVTLAEHTGIFFLDIDLKSDMNGLELAQHIRRIQPRCFIIFITSHYEMGLLTFQYKVEALDFIIKDKAEKIHSKIHDCLLDIAGKHAAMSENVSDHLTITQFDRQLTVTLDEILFLKTSENIHKLTLCCDTQILEFAGQLKDIEPRLDSRFYRCHRSYIINTKRIAEVNYTDLLIRLDNGTVIPLAVRAKRGLKKLLA